MKTKNSGKKPLREKHGRGKKTRQPEKDVETIIGRLVKKRRGHYLMPRNAAEAKGAIFIPRHHLNGAEAGQLVSAALVSHKTKKSKTIGRVTAILQQAESFTGVAKQFLKENGLPTGFPKAVEKEAVALRKKFQARAEGRADLRDEYVVAIDPEGARDHDDAISLTQTESNGWRLGVHIADVSEYVTAESAINKAALKRGFTQYLPWTAMPMLPHLLSSDLCSLLINQDRLAFSCEIEISAAGELMDFEFFESVVRVKQYYTYEAAQALMQKGDAFLKNLSAFAEVLQQRRQRGGLLAFELPERIVHLDESGNPVSVRPGNRVPAYGWIEECMLTANRCAAVFMRQNKIPGIYRVHDNPDPDDIQTLARLESALFGGKNLYQMLKKMRTRTKGLANELRMMYAGLLSRGDGTGEAPISETVQRRILRTMKKAGYSPDCTGHFALGFLDYAHFTSPIRRYPDLWNHRLMKRLLRGKKFSKAWRKEAAGIADKATEQEIEIMKTERKAVRTAVAWVLRDHVGEIFQGRVSGFNTSGIYVLLNEDFVYGDGWIPVSSLRGDYYVFDEETQSMRGRRLGKIFRIDDPIRVRLERTDPVRGYVDLISA